MAADARLSALRVRGRLDGAKMALRLNLSAIFRDRNGGDLLETRV
jgi:alpha-D-ribose 1-methylphosphonate 5-triphosphate synthase subunit PhnI